MPTTLPTVCYLFFGISRRLLQTFRVLSSKDMAVNQTLEGDDALVNEYTQTAAKSPGVRPSEGGWVLPNNKSFSETDKVCWGEEHLGLNKEARPDIVWEPTPSSRCGKVEQTHQ